MSDLLRADVLSGLTILITGASSGIGQAAAISCAKAGAKALILFARSGDKLEEVAKTITTTSENKTAVVHRSVDIQKSSAVYEAVKSVLSEGSIAQVDVLINNAGLAIGAPARFPDLKLEDIDTMVDTNLKGMLYTTHAILNTGMMERKSGTIMNITSTTALEVPPFPGEAIYHTTKAAQEGFTNSLRTELQGTNIRVLALRPGVVADTTFHKQRVGFDKGQYDTFMEGFEPLLAEDVAEQIVWVLAQGRKKERVSVKALDIVPSAQRMLYVIDKEWNERNGVESMKMDDS
ncbi:hypothetical protein PMZ80_011092 [Knufia obscura]|uniref:Uncharacterized protein n=2 Tax=Knufia TaxID=430999 RepID=A0AAN8E8Y3_9EURO|nr:hypothetical protein PMZ80_011092 [Knufia obscura]KAK5947950.1 hypothetical protein OHC33_010991 [Knufia fluminis]